MSTNPFSKAVPGLFQSHLDHLIESAISLDAMRERGYQTVLGRKALEEARFSRSQMRSPGMLIPLHAPDGTPAGYVYRPDKPRETKAGKSIKYETPQGGSVRLDMPPRCRQHARDPHVELWITEGAKKADALASFGLCSLNLSGVWGFKGKSDAGGTALLADFDLLAWQDRQVYIVFDSDIIDKQPVRKAMVRLREHLQRRGAVIHVVRLPHGEGGAKTGVDDYLAAGHTVEDLRALVEKADAPVEEEPLALHRAVYCIEDGQFCVIKTIGGQRFKSPLCNFTAQIADEVILDDGLAETIQYTITGKVGDYELPRVEIPATQFKSLDWIDARWGRKAIVFAGSATAEHLRTLIKLSSNSSAPAKRVFTHTGWREMNGERFFLMPGGAVGREGVEVSLPAKLQGYKLPLFPEGPKVAMAASLRFLDIAPIEATAPLWACMYLAPLAEILSPAFTLWISGRSGSLKSTLSALALCHFGKFTYESLPASWRDTANSLQLFQFVAKDLPLVVDDWHPAPTVALQRELEYKADLVIRGQGNRSGRSRLRADATLREGYIPRGMLISTGEHLPAGESGGARLMVVELRREMFDRARLSAAQGEAALYRDAMAGYILHVRDNWAAIKKHLSERVPQWQEEASLSEGHLRLPPSVAWLYAAVDTALTYATEIGAVGESEAVEIRNGCWGSFLELASRQAWRVDKEGAASRFMELFSALYTQGHLRLLSRDQGQPGQYDIGPKEVFIGWEDREYFYLIPELVWKEAYEHSLRSGQPLTMKKDAVWAELVSLKLATPGKDGRSTDVIWVGGTEGMSKRVVALKRSSVDATPAKL